MSSQQGRNSHMDCGCLQFSLSLHDAFTCMMHNVQAHMHEYSMDSMHLLPHNMLSCKLLRGSDSRLESGWLCFHIMLLVMCLPYCCSLIHLTKVSDLSCLPPILVSAWETFQGSINHCFGSLLYCVQCDRHVPHFGISSVSVSSALQSPLRIRTPHDFSQWGILSEYV